MKKLVLTTALALSLAAAATSEAATQPTLSITATPGLTPAFSTAVSDYWVGCPAGTVSLAVTAPKTTTVSVAGKAAKTGTFSTSLPLTAGREFKWTVTVKTGSKKTTTTHYARCTPADMPIPTATRSGPTKASFYLINPGLPGSVINQTSYIMLVDNNGVPVWWRTAAVGPLNPTVLDSSSIATFIPTSLNPLGDFAFGRWLIWNFNGQLIGRLNSPTIGMDPHELVKLPNGNFLTVSYEPISPIDLSSFGGPAQSTGYRGLIREISADGNVAWSWHADGHISVGELAPWVQGLIQQNSRNIQINGLPAFDLDHISSIEPDSQGFIFSARHLDAIYKISKSTGEILWKIGGTRIPQTLDVVGDTEGGINPLGAPHDARVLPDGTVSVLDDGLGWNRNPRVVCYRINTTTRTATVVSIFHLTGLHASNCCGSARILSNGNWVVDWGANRQVTESNANGNPILTLLLPVGKVSYRAQPITDPKVTAAYLRSAMDKSLTATPAS